MTSNWPPSDPSNQPFGANPGEPGQPYPGQQPGQPHPGPQPGQSYPGPQPGQQFPGQPGPGQQFPGQQFPGQPGPGQQVPGQQFPGQQFPGQPQPGQPYPTQQFPGQQVPGHQFPGQQPPGQQGPGQPIPQPGQQFSQGSDPAGWPQPTLPQGPGEPPARRKTVWPWAAGAVAVVLAGGLVAWLALRDDSPAPVASPPAVTAPVPTSALAPTTEATTQTAETSAATGETTAAASTDEPTTSAPTTESAEPTTQAEPTTSAPTTTAPTTSAAGGTFIPAPAPKLPADAEWFSADTGWAISVAKEWTKFDIPGFDEEAAWGTGDGSDTFGNNINILVEKSALKVNLRDYTEVSARNIEKSLKAKIVSNGTFSSPSHDYGRIEYTATVDGINVHGLAFAVEIEGGWAVATYLATPETWAADSVKVEPYLASLHGSGG